MKAYAYLRVSGKDQVTGDGFPRQGVACEKAASSAGVELAGTWAERGVTGTKLARPAWLAMIAQAQADDIRVVIVEKLDRLARDLMVQETIIRDLKLLGINLLSATEPDLMSSDPTRVMIRQILGAVGQYDKSNIVARMRYARERQRAATGRCEGRKPYGTQPGEPETIRRMVSLQAGGYSLNTIARLLNNDGILPRSGQRWHAKTVSNILARDIESCALSQGQG
jgi:DNA invertase Pin-like site-specific DNA recombinase